MKLNVGLANGTVLVVEGTYDEITSYGDKLVTQFGPDIIKVEDARKLGGQTISLKAPALSPWNEKSVKNLVDLIYGDQLKLLKFFVGRGGTVTYSEIEEHMGYKGQRLSGILSPLTRNAKSATRDDRAKLIDWRPGNKLGARIYSLDPDALPLLKEQLKSL
jgi:hypothetical protein